jgi:hypothetical protein
MNGRVPTEQFEGVIEATNRTGVKIAGAWVNISQFHPVELPETGAHVRVSVDSKGYIRELEVLDAAEKTPAVLSDKLAVTGRDERITRLAVLKAAAEFVGLWGQTREEVRSEHVLAIADKWLAWVNQ